MRRFEELSNESLIAESRRWGGEIVEELSLRLEAATRPWRFHQRDIPKGTLGELSKVREELEEAEDALEQGQELMFALECADMIGAIEIAAQKRGFTLAQLLAYKTLRSRIATEAVHDHEK